MAFATPRQLPGATTLLSCLALGRQVTLSSAMDSIGAVTPQLVVLSSSTTLRITANIEVQITATAVNTATGQWRINGGSWTAFSGATPLAVALTGTPFTLTFPNGTYTNNDPYRSVIGTIVDDLGNVFDGSSASALVRPYIGSVNGLPSVRTDGANKFLRTTTNTLSTALVGGVDTAFYGAWVARYNGSLTPTTSQSIFSFCDGSASGAAFWDFGVATTTGKWRSRKRADSGGTIVNDSATTADNNLHLFEVFSNGTQVTFKVDGTTVINAATQNTTPTVTCQFCDIAQLSVTGVPPNDFYADIDYLTHALYSGNPSTINQGYIRQNLKQMYGTP